MTFTGQKDYQTVLQLNTLYTSAARGGAEQITPNIEVIGGAVNIYGSQVKPTSPVTGMSEAAASFAGITTFDAVPNYLYITQASGTTTSIVVSGLVIGVA